MGPVISYTLLSEYKIRKIGKTQKLTNHLQKQKDKIIF